MKIKLNLIPPEKKKEIIKNHRLKAVFRSEIVLTVAILGFFAVLLSFRYTLNLNFAFHVASQKKNEQATQYGKIAQYDQQFNQINSQISQVTAVENDQLYWSGLFTKLSGIIFPGISLDSLSSSDYVVTLQGQADNRDDLILFKEKLGNENCFSDINLPLSNLVDQNNIEFQISFNIKKNCLENK